MKIHDFTIILDRPESSDEAGADADALYEAGCDDGSISTSGGTTRIDFHREAEHLEAAIASAIADIRSAGFDATEVRLDCHTLSPAPATSVTPAAA